jgi:hypothetical protein
MCSNKLLTSLFTIVSISTLISSCGVGTNNEFLPGQNYFSASYSSYYNIQNGSGANESNLYLSIVSQSTQYVTNVQLIPTSVESQYTFNQNNISGTVTIRNGNLGISYQSSSSAWTDFATQHISNNIPNGTYNLICNQSNLSACQLVVNNNAITLTEYSISGQQTVLCNNASLQAIAASYENPYLFSFNCSNGGSIFGKWYLLPMNYNNQTSLLISEYNNSINENDDVTDEIAFVQPTTKIDPSGTYTYLYNGGSLSGGVGISQVQFARTPASLVNPISCNGMLCVLNQNQYYNNQQQIGFDWYTNTLGYYNLVGSDAQRIYQDSFEGFYF